MHCSQAAYEMYLCIFVSRYLRAARWDVTHGASGSGSGSGVPQLQSAANCDSEKLEQQQRLLVERLRITQ